MDKAVGKAKEAYGALVGDEAKKAEGRAEQRKAEAEAEARQREKTRRAEAEARQAEKTSASSSKRRATRTRPSSTAWPPRRG